MRSFFFSIHLVVGQLFSIAKMAVSSFALSPSILLILVLWLWFGTSLGLSLLEQQPNANNQQQLLTNTQHLSTQDRRDRLQQQLELLKLQPTHADLLFNTKQLACSLKETELCSDLTSRLTEIEPTW